MSRKISKFDVMDFIDPGKFFWKENFNTMCNENAYSDIV